MERELEEGKSDGTARGGTTFSQLFPGSRWREEQGRERKDEMNKDEGKSERASGSGRGERKNSK